MIFRTFKEEDVEPFVLHCSKVFGDVPPEWFRDHWLYDPDRNLNAMFLAEEDGLIISTAQVFKREMYVKGYPVSVGAIGDVTTLEQYRRRGISNRLMQMCIDFMVDNDIVTSLLYTDIQDFYAKLGWFTVPRRSVEVALTDKHKLPQGYELTPFDDGDLHKAEELYHLSAKRFDGALTRKNPKYWSDWVAYYLQRPMALKKDGQMVAWMDLKYDRWWVILNPDEKSDTLYLCDYASLPGEDLFLPMIAEYSRMTNGPVKTVVPSLLMPDYNGAFIDDRMNMFRLNKPFMLGEEHINNAGKLAQVLANTLFWQTDVY